MREIILSDKVKGTPDNTKKCKRLISVIRDELTIDGIDSLEVLEFTTSARLLESTTDIESLVSDKYTFVW